GGNMRKTAITALLMCLVLATLATAQDTAKKAAPAASKKPAAAAADKKAASAMPQPAPELKRLAYFTGDWTTEGTAQPGPFGPGGKFSGRDHSTWLPGHFFVATHGTMEGAMGKGDDMAFMGYDAQKKVYTYHSF